MKARSILIILTVVLFPLSLFLFLVIICTERGRIKWKERLGLWNLSPGKYLWFHGASAGELKGLVPIARRLRAHYPSEVLFLFTSTSPTGINSLPEEFQLKKIFPLDCLVWYLLALRGVKLQGVIIGETEFWPSLLSYLIVKRVPYVFVNLRISSYSFPRYRLLKWLLTPLLRGASLLLCAEKSSFERVQYLSGGASCETEGNAKYDAPPSVPFDKISTVRREYVQSSAPVIVLGSIRPGEEHGWFSAAKKLLNEGKQFSLIVAPRHKEKFEYFAEALVQYELPFIRRSEKKALPEEVPVLLLDSFGELERVYSFSLLSFIGATLIPIGGHNPLEASQYGVFVVVGPYHSVVQEVVELLMENDAAVVIQPEEDLFPLLRGALRSPDNVHARGMQGRRVAEWYRGSTDRTVERLITVFPTTKGNSTL